MKEKMRDSFTENASPETIAGALDGTPESDEQEVLNRALTRIGLRMGVLAYGLPFLEACGVPENMRQKYERNYQEALVKAAAAELGITEWEPLLILANRTPEQEKAMKDLAFRESVSRYQQYLDSNYKASSEILGGMLTEALGISPCELEEQEDREDMDHAVQLLNRYFYVLHGRIDPVETVSLSADAYNDLCAMISKLTDYRDEHGGTWTDSVAPCFRAEALKAMRGGPSITPIPDFPFFYEPISKPNRMMHRIAEAGKSGQPVNVAKHKPGADPVIVNAAICGENGETITIDGFEREIQAAVGNLIMKNNGEMPIIVTPDRIYRECAQLDPEATVTDQQRAETVRVMDKLIRTQARLDFSAQLREHTHLERQKDYNYEVEGAGRLSGTMIVARKIEASWHGSDVAVAYKIYDYPMFFLQAHVVNQIAMINGDLLHLMDRSERKGKASPETRNRSRDAVIKRYLLTRIARMKKTKSVTRRIMIKEILEDNFPGESSPKVERTVREKTDRFLQGLKGQEGGIKSFTVIRHGQKITGFSVVP